VSEFVSLVLKVASDNLVSSLGDDSVFIDTFPTFFRPPTAFGDLNLDFSFSCLDLVKSPDTMPEQVQLDNALGFCAEGGRDGGGCGRP